MIVMNEMGIMYINLEFIIVLLLYMYSLIECILEISVWYCEVRIGV